MTTRTRQIAFGIACTLAASGCDDVRAPERGAALFRSPNLSSSATNAVACSTSHPTEGDDERLLAGHSLVGVTARPSFFGGRETDLRRAINYCLQRFMRAPSRESLSADDPRGLDLLAFLQTLAAPDDSPWSAAQPWSFAERVVPLPPGDAERGQEVYGSACASCHGARGSGEGRAVPLASRVPTDTLVEHGEDESYLVVLQKVRWGQFRGFGGDMPPFATERLSDADLADLAAYLGLVAPP